MATVEEVKFNGNTIWPGASHMTRWQPNIYHFVITVTYQRGPYGTGTSTRMGLVEPKVGSQYGELVESMLVWAQRNCPGDPGSHCITFFNIVPNGRFFPDPQIGDDQDK